MEMSFEDMSELDDLTINRLRLASFLAKAGFSSIEDRKRLMRRERKVLRFYDNETYSKFFLGLDSIGNGVTFGGVRLLEPGKEKEAMRDAMRLSEAMTHKLSMIDEPFGGSKLVVIPPQSGKSDALLQRIGEYVELMQGQFITAIDFGFEPGDALKIRKETKFILGFEGPESIGASGVTTATGAFFGMPVILKEVFGSAIAEGRSFAIQGLGSVGNELAKLLLKAGGRLFVSEPDADKLKPFENIPKVTIVDPNDLLSVKVDVLCPCGPACVLNPITIPKLGAKAVAGVANCVLEDEKRDDILLMKKGILFAPDFVLNAGGVIQGIEEYRGSGLQNSTGKAIKGIEEYRKRGLMQDAVNRLPEISKNLREVFSRAKRKRMGTMAAAKYIARKKREIVMGRLMS